MQYQRHITLPNDVQATTELGMFVEEVCENVGFDMGTTFKLNLAIEEAVVNVMNYAYPAGTKGDVDIDAEADDEQLKFVISDSGTPFDPTQKGEVDRNSLPSSSEILPCLTLLATQTSSWRTSFLGSYCT